jgi:hypothetical protein
MLNDDSAHELAAYDQPSSSSQLHDDKNSGELGHKFHRLSDPMEQDKAMYVVGLNQLN